MNLRPVLIISTLLPLVASCGSSPFTVSGTIGGNSLKAGDAVSAIGNASVNGATLTGAVVVLSNSAGLCSSAAAGKEPKSSQFMTFVMGEMFYALTTGYTPPAVSYTIWPGTGAPTTNWAFAKYAQTDANCNQVQFTVATSGTVTVTSMSNGDVSGNFDITFGGDRVTGSFSAKNCDTLIAVLENSTC